MAAAKTKKKANVKAKKAPAKKKSPAKKKVLKKAAAPKKKAAVPKKTPKKVAPRAAPRPKPAEPPARGPKPGEVRVRVVTHYYGHLTVAAVELGVPPPVGQPVRILGPTSDFRQRVDSMQIEHAAVQEAIGGD